MLIRKSHVFSFQVRDFGGLENALENALKDALQNALKGHLWNALRWHLRTAQDFSKMWHRCNFLDAQNGDIMQAFWTHKFGQFGVPITNSGRFPKCIVKWCPEVCVRALPDGNILMHWEIKSFVSFVSFWYTFWCIVSFVCFVSNCNIGMIRAYSALTTHNIIKSFVVYPSFILFTNYSLEWYVQVFFSL